MKKIKLSVEGMTCPMCEKKVVEALSSLDGVESAEANAKKGVATVVCDDSLLETVAIRAVIDAGFKAKVKRGLLG